MSAFKDAAKAAGFTDQQIAFLSEFLAPTGHHHEIEEVDGLEEALGEVDEFDEEDEEED